MLHLLDLVSHLHSIHSESLVVSRQWHVEGLHIRLFDAIDPSSRAQAAGNDQFRVHRELLPIRRLSQSTSAHSTGILRRTLSSNHREDSFNHAHSSVPRPTGDLLLLLSRAEVAEQSERPVP